MRLNKKELKNILKECLREVLKEEGFMTEAIRQASSEKVLSETGTTQQAPAKPKVNTALMERVDALSQALGKNDKGQTDMMKSLLADTAMTTLQKQLAAGDTLGGNQAGLMTEQFISPEEKKQEEEDLKALTSDGDVNRWAQIAFAK